ncbi:MAG: WS/DGAT domain-containing protein [Halioglobus sp.]
MSARPAVATPWKWRLLWDALRDHLKYDIGNLPSVGKALYAGTVAIKKAADPAISPTLKGINGDIPLAPWNRALSVSNVPGPRTRFEAQGNVVEDLYSAGPLVDGMGLNITVWSYAGHMNF